MTFNHQHGDEPFHDHPEFPTQEDYDKAHRNWSSHKRWTIWIMPTTTRDVDPARQEPTEPFAVTRSELRVLLSGIHCVIDMLTDDEYREIEDDKMLAIAEALQIRIQEVLK